MKALLTWRQVSFKKTHDLDELKQWCLPLAAGAAVQLDGIERLSQYAWRFRYPGAPYAPAQTFWEKICPPIPPRELVLSR